MELARVVQVFSRDSHGNEIVGSGYLLTHSSVLTASHVVGSSLSDVQVESRINKDWSSPVSRVIDLGNDVCVLQCSRRVSGLTGPAPQFGSLGTGANRVSGIAVGYPSYAARHDADAGSYIREVQISGEIATGTGFADKSVTLHLDAVSTPRTSSRSHTSEFAGCSGAALFVGDYLVGVINRDPSPDHPTILEGVRLAETIAAFRRDSPGAAEQLGELIGISMKSAFENATISQSSRAIKVAQSAQIRAVLDGIHGRLRGRGAELLMMRDFCSSSAADYFVWHADAWSGKSALLATFAAEPPSGIDIVSFFINRNRADQRGSRDFLHSIIGQLESYLDEPSGLGNPGTPIAALQGRFLDLLQRASAIANARGRTLVLVVDGLDEDFAFESSYGGAEPIVSLLPDGVPYLKVIIATRPYDYVIDATYSHHPFRRTQARILSKSLHAKGIQDVANRQIRAAASDGGRVLRSVLGLLVSSGQDLTANDLSAAISASDEEISTPAQILRYLQTDLSRTVRRHSQESARPAESPYAVSFEWAHATIPAEVESALGQQFIGSCQKKLRRWADEQLQSGWTDRLPRFFESGYPSLLAASADFEALIRVATHPGRQDWLLARRGGDDQALREISQASQHMQESDASPDLALFVALGFAQARIMHRNVRVPRALIEMWARLGNPTRAIARAISLPDRVERTGALVAIAAALVERADLSNAIDVSRAAEHVANMIPIPYERADALANVAVVYATAGRADEAARVLEVAEGAAHAGPDGYRMTQALIIVANARIATNKPGIAKKVLKVAERRAHAVLDSGLKAQALISIADKYIGVGAVARATRVLHQAERIASDMPSLYTRSEALAQLSATLTAAGLFRDAQRIGESIARDIDKAPVLTKLAVALIQAGERVEAAQVLKSAERAATAINESADKALALAGISSALYIVNESGRAAQVLHAAERAAHAASRDTKKSTALIRVATAYETAGDPARAEAAVRSAIDAAFAETSPWEEPRRADIATDLLEAGRVRDAERVGAMMTDGHWKASVLTAVATAYTAIGEAVRAVHALQAAEQAAIATTDSYSAADALANVANTFAGLGDLAGAEAALRAAERTAATISDVPWKAIAVASVARALISCGDRDAASRILEAAERAVSPTSVDHRGLDVLVAIAEAYTAAGDTNRAVRVLQLAELAALSTSDWRWQVELLLRVANGYSAAGHLEGAEAIANKIPVSHLKADVLTGVALGYATARDQTRAAQAFQAAENSALLIADVSWRSETMARIASALIAAGNARDAQRIGNSIPATKQRTRVLAAAGRAYIAANDWTNASRALRLAEEASSRLGDDHERAKLLLHIGDAYVAADKLAPALRAIEGAETAARAMPEDYWKTKVLIDVARAYTTGACPDHAARTLEAAENVANALRQADMRAHTLIAVANALTASGNATRAGTVLGAAERAAFAISDSQWRTEALTNVAHAFSQAGQPAKAADMLHAAQHSADSIRDSSVRTEALVGVAITSAAAQYPARAMRALDAAEATARTVPDPYLMAEVMISVARAHTAIGHPHPAERLMRVGLQDVAFDRYLSELERMTSSGELSVEQSAWPTRFISGFTSILT